MLNIWNGLFLLFVGLKLTNYIDWSWWLIFSPLIIGFVVIWLFTFITLLWNEL